MKRDEIIGGITLLMFGGITTLFSLQMPIGTFRLAGPGLFPLILGILLMILSGVFLLNIFRKRYKESGKKRFGRQIRGWRRSSFGGSGL